MFFFFFFLPGQHNMGENLGHAFITTMWRINKKKGHRPPWLLYDFDVLWSPLMVCNLQATSNNGRCPLCARAFLFYFSSPRVIQITMVITQHQLIRTRKMSRNPSPESR
jgi:hypothetical protein